MSQSIKPHLAVYNCSEIGCDFSAILSAREDRPFMTQTIQKSNSLNSYVALFLTRLQEAAELGLDFKNVLIACPKCNHHVPLEGGFVPGKETDSMEAQYHNIMCPTTPSVSIEPIIDLEAIRAKPQSQRTTEDWKHLADNLGEET